MPSMGRELNRRPLDYEASALSAGLSLTVVESGEMLGIFKCNTFHLFLVIVQGLNLNGEKGDAPKPPKPKGKKS